MAVVKEVWPSRQLFVAVVFVFCFCAQNRDNSITLLFENRPAECSTTIRTVQCETDPSGACTRLLILRTSWRVAGGVWR